MTVSISHRTTTPSLKDSLAPAQETTMILISTHTILLTILTTMMMTTMTTMATSGGDPEEVADRHQDHLNKGQARPDQQGVEDPHPHKGQAQTTPDQKELEDRLDRLPWHPDTGGIYSKDIYSRAKVDLHKEWRNLNNFRRAQPHDEQEQPFQNLEGKNYFPTFEELSTLQILYQRHGGKIRIYFHYVAPLLYGLLGLYILTKMSNNHRRPDQPTPHPTPCQPGPQEPCQNNQPKPRERYRDNPVSPNIHGYTVTAQEALQPYTHPEMGHLLPGVAALHHRLVREHERTRVQLLGTIVTKRQLLKDINLINQVAMEREYRLKKEELEKKEKQAEAREEGDAEEEGEEEDPLGPEGQED